MADSNDDHAAKLVEALLPAVTKAVEDSIAKRIEDMDKQVSERLDGIASKNDQLLSRLHREREGKTSLEEQLATLTKQLSGDTRPNEVVLSKIDARDPRKYQAAKKQAAELGVGLRIDREAS